MDKLFQVHGDAIEGPRRLKPWTTGMASLQDLADALNDAVALGSVATVAGRVDGSLSQDAQGVWPGALVWDRGTDGWILERPGIPAVGLGASFGFAKQALRAMIAAARGPQPGR